MILRISVKIRLNANIDSRPSDLSEGLKVRNDDRDGCSDDRLVERKHLGSKPGNSQSRGADGPVLTKTASIKAKNTKYNLAPVRIPLSASL